MGESSGSGQGWIGESSVMNEALYRLVPILNQIVDGFKQARVLTNVSTIPPMCMHLLCIMVWLIPRKNMPVGL